MNQMTIADILEKLIGPIDPVGETHEDNRRLENLKIFEEVTEAMVIKLIDVGQNEVAKEYSVKRAGQHAIKKVIELKSIIGHEV